MKRRTFFRNTTLASLSTVSLSGSAKYSWLKPLVSMDNTMRRRNLLPVFMVEDVLRLIHHSSIQEKLIDALQINRSFVHLGAANNLSNDYRLKMIKDSLEKWGNEATFDEGQTQVSYLLGSVLYPLIDKHLPYQLPERSSELQLPPLPDEAIYFDVMLMRAMYSAEPFLSDQDRQQALAGTKVEDLVELLHLIRQRNLIRTHTFRPEFSDVESWLEDFLRYHHVLEEEDRRYAVIYLNPQSIQNEDTWHNFYKQSDDIIQLARDTQVGISESGIDLQEARKSARQQSTYAQTLALCLDEISQWSDCIEGKINQNDFISNYR